MRSWRYAGAIGALVHFGCSGPTQVIHVPDASPDERSCPTPDELLRRVDDSGYAQTPETWEIECNAAKATRLGAPASLKVYLASSTLLGAREHLVSRHLAEWDRIEDTYPVNWSPALMAALPPYADANGAPLTYPVAEPYASQKLNVAGAAYLRQKARGKPVTFANYYPPNQAPPAFASKDAFLTYYRTVILPEKEREARFAESLKLEAMMPFPNEIERIVLSQGEPIASLPAAEKVAIAQVILDDTFARVRPLFSGVLIAASYAKYESDMPNTPADGTAWKSLNFSKFDAVTFGLFPQCSKEVTERYAKAQLSHVREMVARDHLSKWIVGEVMVDPTSYAACGVSEAAYTALEPDLFRTIIAAIQESTERPQGLMVDAYLIKNEATHAVIADYWR